MNTTTTTKRRKVLIQPQPGGMLDTGYYTIITVELEYVDTVGGYTVWREKPARRHRRVGTLKDRDRMVEKMVALLEEAGVEYAVSRLGW